MESNEERKYCVYMHISPSGKRYIGITGVKPEKRWGNGKRYNGNPYLSRAIQKYGWDNFQHIILYKNLTKEEAEQLEIDLIAYYKSNQRDFGYNIENGGNTTGKMSDETRQKISEANKGKVVSDDTRQKLSNIRKECWEDDDYRQNQIEKHKWQTGENHPWFGRNHTEETKKKIGAANTKFAVFCIELNMIFVSSEEAKRQTGVDASDIRKSCKGLKKSAGKHPITGEKLHWEFIERDVVDNDCYVA